jgi:hypothetical protein
MRKLKVKSYKEYEMFLHENDNRSALLSIPYLNWCFLIDYAISHEDEKPKLKTALLKFEVVSQLDVDYVVDDVYHAIFNK